MGSKEMSGTREWSDASLKERRLKMRMTQSVFSKMAAVSLCNYRELEAMRTSPLRKDGEWREIVLVLARFHCVEPEELFPRMARAVKEPVVVRYMAECRSAQVTEMEKVLCEEALARNKKLHTEVERLEAEKAALHAAVNARPVEDPDADWTVDPATGRSNSSAEFQRLETEITRLIQDSGWALIHGQAQSVAGLILAQLAHVHGMAPKKGA